MASFEPGDAVAIPATVQPGAFPGEHLVTVQTSAGAVSGFVGDKDIVDSNTIYAIVRGLTPTALKVQLSGSYFTTNGLAEFPTDWANQHVKAIA